MGRKKGINQALNKSGKLTIKQGRHKLCKVKKVKKIIRRISTVFNRKNKKPFNSIDSEKKPYIQPLPEKENCNYNNKEFKFNSGLDPKSINNSFNLANPILVPSNTLTYSKDIKENNQNIYNNNCYPNQFNSGMYPPLPITPIPIFPIPMYNNFYANNYNNPFSSFNNNCNPNQQFISYFNYPNPNSSIYSMPPILKNPLPINNNLFTRNNTITSFNFSFKSNENAIPQNTNNINNFGKRNNDIHVANANLNRNINNNANNIDSNRIIDNNNININRNSNNNNNDMDVRLRDYSSFGFNSFYDSFDLYNDYLFEEPYDDSFILDDYTSSNRNKIKSIKNNLSKIKFKKNKDMESKCAICIEDFKNNQNVYNLPCSHIFHIHCLNKELENRQKCPICRKDIKENND